MLNMLSNTPDSRSHPMIRFSSDRSSAGLRARADFVAGTKLWPLWVRLGWNDISQKYRRSILGPLWLTLSMAIMVVALGVLYSELFKTPLQDLMPFLCVGLLVWNYLASFFTEAGTLFVGSESYIKQIRLPYSVYVYRSTWSRFIIFAHNFVIYFGVLIYFEIWPGATALWAIPGLLILTFNGAVASLLIGLISARFRDIPQVINAMIQIVLFVTPIMWKPELLRSRPYIAELNPFFHMIEIVRAPLLGNLPTLNNYVAVLLITVVNVALTAMFFTRFRSRLAYWV